MSYHYMQKLFEATHALIHDGPIEDRLYYVSMFLSQSDWPSYLEAERKHILDALRGKSVNTRDRSYVEGLTISDMNDLADKTLRLYLNALRSNDPTGMSTGRV